MDDATALFDLPGFRVLECVENPDDAGRRVVIGQVVDEHACPGCGVFASEPYDVRTMAVKDLPVAERALMVVWRKRRYRCLEVACRRRIFTESSSEIPPRHRITARLRRKLESAASGSARAVSDVAGEYGVSWWAVNDALVRRAAALADEARSGEPSYATRVLGIDETRSRSVRWLREDTTWRRSDPWMTSFVDLDSTHSGGLLGLVPGRSGASVTSWLGTRSDAWRAGIEVVAIDPSAPFAAAIRRELPNARIVVDHWHLVRLANAMVTEVRQRVAREQLGRRGRKADPAWAHRTLLLRAGDRLTARGRARLVAVLRADDPTNEIGAAWGVKELLRQLLAAREPHVIRRRLHAFYQAVITADMPETTRLANTIDRWWPEILAFLDTGITNARTEGYNRTIKQIKRVGCGHRNQAAYERRILLHIAAKKAA